MSVTRIVEFFGLPGVGKSYLCSKYQEYLNDELCYKNFYTSLELTSYTSKTRVLNKILVIVSTPAHDIFRACIFAFKISLFVKPSRFLKIFFNWIFVTCLCMTRGTKSKYLILDQGIIQALWSTLYAAKHIYEVPIDSLLQDLLKLTSINYLSVFSVSSVNTESRFFSRAKALKLQQYSLNWSRAYEAHKYIYNLLAGLDFVKLIDIENNLQSESSCNWSMLHSDLIS